MKETTLRPHQKRILEENPSKALLVHAMRTGKSLIGERWTKHLSRNQHPLVICTKKNKKEWLARCPHATVYTKEEFKKFKDTIKDVSCLLVDEAHHFYSPLFIAKKRSQLSAALYELLKANPDLDRMFLSGTPLTNDPASIHSALCFLGHYIPWGAFRDQFYTLTVRPYLPRPAYIPNNDWRVGANALLVKYADIVSLHDVVDELPPVTEEVVEIKTPKKKYGPEEEQTWVTDHRQEQTLKWEWIKEFGEQNRKVIIVCHYIEQMEELAAKLKNHKPVFVVNGKTKDQEGTIKEAQESPDAYLIVQAAMGEGYDGYMFDAMIFASMPHRVLFHTQMKARLDTVEKLLMKPKFYFYLIGGSWDEKIYKSVKKGEDFDIHKHL